MNILILFLVSVSISGWKIPFTSKKTNIHISPKIPFPIDGFYGLIGPEIDTTKINTLFDLFTGNGIIQGIFIENGTATFSKTFLQTEKRILEKSKFLLPFPFINWMGVANTAFLQYKDKTYALFERDNPYLIDIQHDIKTVDTLGKYPIEEISHFSAHSKIRCDGIETIDYDILRKKTTIYQLDHYFRIKTAWNIPMKYIPIIHDFISTPTSMVLLNSAFAVRMEFSLFPKKTIMSMELDRTKTSIFYRIDRETQQIDRYYTDYAMYIFHYADVYETEREIEIYAPVFESLDFAKLELHGKYRKIILDKKTKSVKIERNLALEKFDLEFPVPFFHDDKQKILLRYVDAVKDTDVVNSGFIICHKLEMETQIDYPGKCICGEPAILFLDDSANVANVALPANVANIALPANVALPHAIFFTIDKDANGFFNVLNLVTLEKYEIPVLEKMTIGFHSIFQSRK